MNVVHLISYFWIKLRCRICCVAMMFTYKYHVVCRTNFPFQIAFSSVWDLLFLVTTSSVFTFPSGHSDVAYVFFLLLLSLHSFPLSSLLSHVFHFQRNTSSFSLVIIHFIVRKIPLSPLIHYSAHPSQSFSPHFKTFSLFLSHLRNILNFNTIRGIFYKKINFNRNLPFVGYLVSLNFKTLCSFEQTR